MPGMTALGSYRSSIGLVYSFSGDQLPAGVMRPGDLIGKTVEIDGVLRRIRGAEHWAIECRGRCAHPFGLLVGEDQ